MRIRVNAACSTDISAVCTSGNRPVCSGAKAASFCVASSAAATATFKMGRHGWCSVSQVVLARGKASAPCCDERHGQLWGPMAVSSHQRLQETKEKGQACRRRARRALQLHRAGMTPSRGTTVCRLAAGLEPVVGRLCFVCRHLARRLLHRVRECSRTRSPRTLSLCSRVGACKVHKCLWG